jgi:hypothetical protein
MIKVTEGGAFHQTDTGPDLAFQENPDTDPGFEDQKVKKNKAENIFFSCFDQKFNLLIPRPP